MLYQDCHIIKGAKNILLCDIYRHNIVNITLFYDKFQKDRFLIKSPDNSELIDFLQGKIKLKPAKRQKRLSQDMQF